MARESFFITLLVAVVALCAGLASASGWKETIAFTPQKNGLTLSARGKQAALIVDAHDWPGVIRAANDLGDDFKKVTGSALKVTLKNTIEKRTSRIEKRARDVEAIIVGTVGKSKIIDELVAAKKIDVSKIEGQWEAFKTQIVENPIPGVSRALVIAGADKRGSIYGIYDISEQIGVSPWYYWADVPPKSNKAIYAINTERTQGASSVKYRGIFLNDEQPALTNWVYEKFGNDPGYGHEFYSKVFELLLRIRANYLWPTMWDGMFGVDDPKNQYTADLYGIVMSTSHTEPLMRSTKEWNALGNGTWDYTSNKANIYPYWVEGVERGKDFENHYIMGMRGNGDNVLAETVVTDLLESIVADQRKILKDVLKVDDLSTIPQAWCLYKDIQSYYEAGLRVPDDITLLWADDNWGNIRRLPTANETDRVGGAGVYYHFDYVGDPRDYKWINTISLQKTWEQMNQAYHRQAREIWVVNVGDLKPLELPIDYFVSLGYDFDRWGAVNTIEKYLEHWAKREFGPKYAKEIAVLANEYGKMAGRRKFELVDLNTYSIIHYREAERILAEWKDLSARADAVLKKLPKDAQPAFFQLIAHPARAAYIVHDIHISSAKNNLYATQRRNSANVLADYVRKRFQDDYDLTKEYHSLLGGKWNHMMDQTHLGYEYWQQPMRNTLPPLAYTQTLDNSLDGSLGISWESSNGSVPGDHRYNVQGYNNHTALLPVLDPYGPSSRWFEIYNQGTEDFTFKFKPHNDWVKVSPSSGSIKAKSKEVNDIRVEVSVDWSKVPEGFNVGFIDVETNIGHGNFPKPDIHVQVNKTSVPAGFKGFPETNKQISIEVDNFSRNKTGSTNAWYQLITGAGKEGNAVGLFPETTEASLTPETAPVLEYDLYQFTDMGSRTANVTLTLKPALNIDPYRPLQYAIAIGDETPQIIRYIPAAKPLDMPAGWEKAVSDMAWKITSSHKVGGPGKKTLKLWALEPAVVFQKFWIDFGGVKPSYLGPPETKKLE